MHVKFLLPFLCFFLIDQLFAYSFSRGRYGEFPKWSSQYSHISMYFRPDNSSSIPDSMVSSILSDSVDSWNNGQYNDLSASLFVSPIDSLVSGRNEIYFDSTSPYFAGGGVVGVTQLVYRSGTGEILEADIALNDNYQFSTNPEDRFYLGNVVTHEMGHVFGVGHSEVQGASMFYMLHPHQHSLATDDAAAMTVLYPGSGGRGKISGKIVGGTQKVGIFAAHVQAISRTKGAVIASALSEDDGTFVIGGLPLEDDYYIYIGPPKYLAAQTSFYQSARTNFCEGGKNYRGSFFESCYSDQKGFPNSIHLGYAHSSEDIGQATIRCDLSVPQAVVEKTDVVIGLDQTKTFGSFTGFFAANQFNLANAQYVQIDLRGSGFDSTHYLDLKMLSQGLYSTGRYRLHIYAGVAADLAGDADYIVEPDDLKAGGDKNLEIATEVQLTDDFYTLKIEPVSKDFDQSLYFENFDLFKDSYNMYLLMYSVKKKIGSAMSFYSGPIFEGDDNSYCPAAVNSYTVVSNSTDYTPPKLTSKEEGQAVSCGTIGELSGNDKGGGGPSGMLFGFCLIVGLSMVLRVAEKAKSNLSNYWL